MTHKTSQQLALDAEKIFSSESLLLVTFHEQELNRSVIKQLHSDIKNVHILHPIFIPKRRCIIEIEVDIYIIVNMFIPFFVNVCCRKNQI